MCIFQEWKFTQLFSMTHTWNRLPVSLLLHFPFYCTTLWVSVVFAVGVCLWPSRWCIVPRRLKISSYFFSRPGSPIVLVFWDPPVLYNSKGNPLNAGFKYMEVGNLRLPYLQADPCISQIVHDSTSWAAVSRRPLDSAVRAPGCKNRPAPFPDRMSYKATKPCSVCFSLNLGFYSVLM